MNTLEDTRKRLDQLEGQTLAVCAFLACLARTQPLHVQQSLLNAFEKEVLKATEACILLENPSYAFNGLKYVSDVLHNLVGHK
ncbi:hypothetical protein SAMN05216412_11035 [Nitrosospira multiformis]|uniref:Uncharacterized protein n=1 Tax=Nitrosospira multiformis TaxID=1231 RepID=A0A1I0FSB0_9PROT|nr:hypothetical protein SAMN05216412_11035 [Nitrosospira multiformis]